MTPVWVVTAAAIALAVVDAVCFGVASVLQHRGMAHTIDHEPASEQGHWMGVRAFTRLFSQRIWLAGLATMMLGAGLHVVALFLAPVSLIQPIGVLAVPVAVLLTARRTGPIARGVKVGIVLCVIGTATFVWLAAGRVASVPVTGRELAITGLTILGVVVVMVLLALPASRWLRCIAYACGAAVAFGFVSALMRAVSQHLDGNFTRVFDPIVLIMLAIIVASMLAGGWCVQHAFRAGAPAVVMACLTVVDPLVAVILGVVLLGEGAGIDLPIAAGMVVFGLVAAAGVVALSKHHPEITARISEPEPAFTSTSFPALDLPERSARHEDHARR